MSTDNLDLDAIEERVRRFMTPTSGSYIRDVDALALIAAARERDAVVEFYERWSHDESPTEDQYVWWERLGEVLDAATRDGGAE